MAKQAPAKGGTSRIRFIMLEAEIPEGDLTQITAAIQNALKPTVIQQRLPPQVAASHPVAEPTDADSERLEIEDVEDDSGVSEVEVSRKTRPARVRKPVVPNVIDVDLTSDPSLESFSASHPPKSDIERNLVVAAFFKEHRGLDAITVDHVYTCYRAMGWPSGIEDFGQSLRHLKQKQLVGNPERGQYAINHLGTARVLKLGSV